MARVRGNSRTAYNLKIKKQEEEKDAIKHGTRKVTNTSRTGKKEYKYWDSNKRKWVKKENFTKENKSFTKTNPKQTLSNEEIKKLQDKANEDRKFGKLSSRTDKGYQKPDTPPELKDTTTESSSNNGGSNNQSSNTNNKENKVENTEKANNEDKKKTTGNQKKNKDPLAKYRRTKGEGVGKGDTRITKNLKKAGFTETRLAELRKQNAAFQKAKKGGKEAMKKYREKYPKRG